MANNNLILISGASTTGKSASLRNLTNPEGVAYLNTESNKSLPFSSKFKQKTITDPLDIEGMFLGLEDKPDLHTIIVDSLTFALDMFESQYVLTAANKMTAWGDFQQFFKRLMQETVATSTKNVIFTAHTLAVMNEATMDWQTSVPVKGALKSNGIESYFNTVVSTKRVPLKALDKYQSDLLNITEDDEINGFKYVFQTKLTKETTGERIRTSIGMFDTNETFIDNDVQLVLDRIHQYYN